MRWLVVLLLSGVVGCATAPKPKLVANPTKPKVYNIGLSKPLQKNLTHDQFVPCVWTQETSLLSCMTEEEFAFREKVFQEMVRDANKVR